MDSQRRLVGGPHRRRRHRLRVPGPQEGDAHARLRALQDRRGRAREVPRHPQPRRRHAQRRQPAHDDRHRRPPERRPRVDQGVRPGRHVGRPGAHGHLQDPRRHARDHRVRGARRVLGGGPGRRDQERDLLEQGRDERLQAGRREDCVPQEQRHRDGVRPLGQAPQVRGGQHGRAPWGRDVRSSRRAQAAGGGQFRRRDLHDEGGRHGHHPRRPGRPGLDPRRGQAVLPARDARAAGPHAHGRRHPVQDHAGRHVRPRPRHLRDGRHPDGEELSRHRRARREELVRRQRPPRLRQRRRAAAAAHRGRRLVRHHSRARGRRRLRVDRHARQGPDHQRGHELGGLLQEPAARGPRVALRPRRRRRVGRVPRDRDAGQRQGSRGGHERREGRAAQLRGRLVPRQGDQHAEGRADRGQRQQGVGRRRQPGRQAPRRGQGDAHGERRQDRAHRDAERGQRLVREGRRPAQDRRRRARDRLRLGGGRRARRLRRLRHHQGRHRHHDHEPSRAREDERHRQQGLGRRRQPGRQAPAGDLRRPSRQRQDGSHGDALREGRLDPDGGRPARL